MLAGEEKAGLQAGGCLLPCHICLPLVIGMATLKCRQKQRFKKVLGGWEKNKFLEERAA